MKPTPPEKAARTLMQALFMAPWAVNAQVAGPGEAVAIELLTTSLQDAEAFIQGVGGRWSGHPVRARKVAT